MKLSEKQRLFTKLQAEFVTWCFEQGYELTDGDAYRDGRSHGEFGEKKGYSAAKSVHKVRLARDYNLRVNNKYISDGSHPAWYEMGLKWESMHKLARWGGRFKDSNHFSFEYQGCR